LADSTGRETPTGEGTEEAHNRSAGNAKQTHWAEVLMKSCYRLVVSCGAFDSQLKGCGFPSPVSAAGLVSKPYLLVREIITVTLDKGICSMTK